ncbi:HTH-type transcriptional repressor FabR [Zhongshania aliphaticivorans]|uniref:HTH-type transcriptional repressor FabR n=1 Tax=Zhongshania aliphaticivorans TaxID=1470434 RepID=A0A5S9MUX5_9GAMM|nr:TetR family transcriptional regulator [Zhongshania aliphaticivorans]CAA0081039.1 HTH-type transcriptional repressor FabR [Zhongshania aliphaticivorans]CAA0085169.1 HTH-type transcriptional repressor FabR [Zhongshania aliphaticivorans]
MSRPQKRHRGHDDTLINTRQALLEAALELMSRDKSFDGISLREVTREVGITPGAFYRHFPDMNSLGLELVTSSFSTLRAMLITARATSIPEELIIRRSVETFIIYVRAHHRQFQFISREAYGGVATIRNAINNEFKQLETELTDDLARLVNNNNWTADDLQMLASLMIGSMIQIVSEQLMGRPNGEDDAALIQKAEKQLRLITLGANAWHSSDFQNAI